MEVEPGISDVPSLAVEITVGVPEHFLRCEIELISCKLQCSTAVNVSDIFGTPKGGSL